MKKSSAESASTPLRPPSRLTRKKLLITMLKLGLGTLAVYIIIQKVDLTRVGIYMKQVNWALLGLAFMGFFISKLFAALRINCYYRTQNLHLAEWLNIKLNLLAMFYSLFIPLVGGEGYRIYWLRKRYPAPLKALIWTLLVGQGEWIGRAGWAGHRGLTIYWNRVCL